MKSSSLLDNKYIIIVYWLFELLSRKTMLTNLDTQHIVAWDNYGCCEDTSWYDGGSPILFNTIRKEIGHLQKFILFSKCRMTTGLLSYQQPANQHRCLRFLSTPLLLSPLKMRDLLVSKQNL